MLFEFFANFSHSVYLLSALIFIFELLAIFLELGFTIIFFYENSVLEILKKIPRSFPGDFFSSGVDSNFDMFFKFSRDSCCIWGHVVFEFFFLDLVTNFLNSLKFGEENYMRLKSVNQCISIERTQ